MAHVTYRGPQKETIMCDADSKLLESRLAVITKSTKKATYASYGSVAEGQITAHSTPFGAAYLANIYPLAALVTTFWVTCHRAVVKGAKLFPSLEGTVVSPEYVCKTRSLLAEPEGTKGDIYLLSGNDDAGAGITGNAWATHAGLAVKGADAYTFVDVSAKDNLGLTVYVTDEKKYYTWNGAAWVQAHACAFAAAAGLVGQQIEAYRSDDMFADVSASIAFMGQYAGNPGGTTLAISDSRVRVGDKVICTFQGTNATAGYVVNAIATAGVLTLKLSADTGANTVISYFVVR